MSLLLGQSSARMADDLCYATTQTSALMVATTDWVRLAGAIQGQLKVLQGALAGLREEVRDSEAECLFLLSRITFRPTRNPL